MRFNEELFVEVRTMMTEKHTRQIDLSNLKDKFLTTINVIDIFNKSSKDRGDETRFRENLSSRICLIN